jgi:hypothetical protein
MDSKAIVYLQSMTIAWNFERRRDTCTCFLLGVSNVVSGLADKSTTLEAVRNRMRLSPEEALFAARHLATEHMILFDPGGKLQSTARGIERAAVLADAVRTRLLRAGEGTRMIQAGGTPLLAVAAVIRFDGGSLACSAPDENDNARHRLTLVGDQVTLERAREDGSFHPVTENAD